MSSPGGADPELAGANNNDGDKSPVSPGAARSAQQQRAANQSAEAQAEAETDALLA